MAIKHIPTSIQNRRKTIEELTLELEKERTLRQQQEMEIMDQKEQITELQLALCEIFERQEAGNEEKK